MAVHVRITSEEQRKKSEKGSDGVYLRNPHISVMKEDVLYHLALGSGSHDLAAMFGDVKFVCMAGTASRALDFAIFIKAEMGVKFPTGTTLLDVSRASDRYSLYKVGPVLAVNHGMGMPSLGILLHEIIKLMHHARVRNPVFFRLGTCGGLGIKGGTVVISDGAVDGMLNPYYELSVLGKKLRRPAKFDRHLIAELLMCRRPEDRFDTVVGKTMCTDDFYESQGRLDGAFCDYKESDKMEFLFGLKRRGVLNIEMESLAFAALTHHAGIRSAVVCVALLDRLQGDQITASKELLEEYQRRPQQLVARYIQRTRTSILRDQDIKMLE